MPDEDLSDLQNTPVVTHILTMVEKLRMCTNEGYEETFKELQQQLYDALRQRDKGELQHLFHERQLVRHTTTGIVYCITRTPRVDEVIMDTHEGVYHFCRITYSDNVVSLVSPTYVLRLSQMEDGRFAPIPNEHQSLLCAFSPP